MATSLATGLGMPHIFSTVPEFRPMSAGKIARNNARLSISQSRRRELLFWRVFEVKYFQYTLFAGPPLCASLALVTSKPEAEHFRNRVPNAHPARSADDFVREMEQAAT